MFKFSSKSLEKLRTCHPDLQKILNEVIKYYDIIILEGIRTIEIQEEYVRSGRSKTMYSKHLQQPDGYSHAVDVALYPIDWQDRDRFVFLQGFIKGMAKKMLQSGEITYDIRLGIDWNDNGNIKEHSFFDGPHIELKY